MIDDERIGTLVGHYRLERVLAEGGMGVVFLARDTRLDRKVAIKFLSKGRADPETSRRFRKEALTLSRLNHPGIATVHDYDEHEGVPFLVLEYVEGASLAEQLARGAPLEPERVVELALQLASALEYTHERGIVHRDLKPANVVLTTEGNAKLLDFGVAQWAIADEEYARLHDITKVTETVGTLPYMAPEQLIGITEERSDIFSLGVMMFELLTGQRPFRGPDAAAIMDAIRTRPPSPSAGLVERAPSWLASVVLRCLEKAPEDRFQRATELRAALATGGAAPRSSWGRAGALLGLLALLVLLSKTILTTIGQAGGHPRSIAVLPFRNASGDAALDYLSDGITEALIGEFGRISALHVTSRTSVMRYRESALSLPEIAAELSVDAVLEGSVSATDDQIRVTVELRSGENERRLWGGDFDASIEQILKLQRDLVRETVEGGGIELTSAELARLRDAGAIHPEAWRQVQRGRYFWEQRVPDSFQRSIECFHRAIELDPEAAMAHAELSRPYCILALWGVLAPHDAIPLAMASAERALALDDSQAWAHVALAWTRFVYDRDLPAARRGFERAIGLQPSNATAHEWFALMLAASGEPRQAVHHMQTALSLDEFSSVMNSVMGTVYGMAGELERATAQLESAVERYPTFPLAHSELGYIHLKAGRYEEACGAFQRRRDIARDSAVDAAYAHAKALAGAQEEARALLLELTEARSAGRGGYVSPVLLGFVHAALGELERAFEWMALAEEERDTWLMLMHGRAGPELLAADPRWDALLERIGMAAR